jgi:RsiW-degrading membrane proteinase PrsW (M82 family)
MSELRVTFNGQLFTFSPVAAVRIGRSSDNDIVVSDPTVSRQHARLAPAPAGWEWQNVGQALTFLDGQPVASFTVANAVEVRLASPQGPTVRLDVPAAPGQPQGPIRTELAAPIDPPPGAAPPAYGAAPAAAPAAAAAAAAAAQPFQQAAAVPGPPAPSFQQAPPGYVPQVPPGYAAPPGMPGWPPTPPPYGPPPGQAGGAPLALGSFFHTLIPIQSWLHDRGWRQGLRLLIIPYALLPLIFLQLFSTSMNLATPGWAYSLYIAPLWLLAFWYLIRPPQLGWREVGIAAGIIVWVVIWIHVVTININDSLLSRTRNGPPPTLTFSKALVVGFNEEITKALPVLLAAALLLAIGKVKLDPRTWMFMGCIAGLTFGIVEQAIYTQIAILQIHQQNISASVAIEAELSFVFRVFVDGFQHAVWAGISGFFIGLAVNYRRRRIPLLLLGVSIPAVLHALNDWTLGVFSTVWVTVFLVQGTSLLLFLGYTLSASSIERQVRRDPAFRGQSMLMERFTEPGQSPGP